MPRRGSVKVRQTEPDPIYKNRLITKFINRAMRDGKKSTAQKEIYRSFELIKSEGEDPVKIFSQAIENVKPGMEVRPRRIGGAAYQVPIPVRGTRKESLAIRWIIGAAQGRSNSEFRTFAEKLAAEFKDAAKSEGLAVKKKIDMERMAEANRAFAHFRW
ncbi:30S ribosomal protein S7 [Candidatus Woesebacteria bacterium RIFCSPLOWO2_01_FULL_39_23]|uniref:Small ribosomal subunit protein uS7 n=2 Tax=Microgenomates group TaxID=1794810 RepID=A0A0H4TNR8_9BACT|nr:30S ribosomal protein S7, small subunit ribosomal protein S7 [uncultured Microgenomates bacterium Rifle_16ft_4_minimus_37633]OGM13867.1 MAG: 30S ribosomal protein S7 [Candidatus Woesebacteria bacterium RBG_16_40_11]OGM27819.1 MAG: 30S ribosomal protein S7 [Candidatus Woesebacteria bacterium RIFCSPHIGHO2_01_FULL_40_22]OGM36071.1 MAG: 30S ribosomal protein S7 [Candidatus Woesebacteria bacterium RIFCSPHIGHO2_12_FULL_38_9]OGM62241.1 MAG: 30S ribosomal protein S7 [Candidatus Woesebacteria bacteri